ncbi:hypothetical protein [Cylindrospermum stagnale]|uniref:hypothetical protein n=1 Tax=Cylindrospermum stagnale TaxID=142864 RepID=UPI0002DBF943|nr:hypothetical protein [Cylindrospermum stagnale]
MKSGFNSQLHSYILNKPGFFSCDGSARRRHPVWVYQESALDSGRWDSWVCADGNRWGYFYGFIIWPDDRQTSPPPAGAIGAATGRAIMMLILMVLFGWIGSGLGA